MEQSRERRGSNPRKLGTSSFLLQLTPDSQVPSEAVRRRSHSEGFPSNFQLTQTRVEEGARHDTLPAGTQSLQWSREGLVPLGLGPPGLKPRLSRSKRRPGSLELDTGLGDHIVLTDSPVAPGVPVVYRPPEERAANPDRLNLDRRHLSVCPLLEGEERLRLLNLQHNCIARLQHLGNLRRLVFLDLYDNLLTEPAGLEGLLSLRVLMLGKNRIRRISGLQTLTKLDVLDLHGNMIRDVEQLSHLSHLRVLNLAGNEISCVTQLAGLHSLMELNLRRNRITIVYEVDQLARLQRLFLSHNLIQSFADMQCLCECGELSELTLDGNPLANAPDYRASILFHLRRLYSLDQLAVTEEERSEAVASAREDQEREREQLRAAQQQEHKSAVVAVLQSSWDTAHNPLGDSPVTTGEPSTTSCRTASAEVDGIAWAMLRSPILLHSPSLLHPASSLLHPAPSFLIDHCDYTLHLFGGGALSSLLSAPPGTPPVREMHCHCMEPAELARWLPSAATSCPQLNSLVLERTGLASLEQLHALAGLGCVLHSLTVCSRGNPVTRLSLFRTYTLFRLHHLGLRELNGAAVSAEELARAERLFGSLAVSTSTLPPARLAALVGNKRPTGSKRSPFLSTESPTGGGQYGDPPDRAALCYHDNHSLLPDAAASARHEAAAALCSSLLHSTLELNRKQRLFEGVWPRVLASRLRSALQECSHLDAHMQALLEGL